MSNNDNQNSSNRWLGLQPFTEFHQDIFYGRTREVQDLLRRVEQRHLTVLFGKSGLGKTSLLRAGLVPKLRKARLFPIIHRIDHSLDSPPPVDQLKHAISEAIGVNIPRDLELSTWCHDTHERTNRESGLASESLRGVTPVIIIDQFEEVFTLGQQSELAMKRSQDYLRELADLVEVRIPERLENAFETGEETPEDYQFESSSYRLVFAIREDFLSDLERCRHLMPSLMDNRQPLDQLTGDKALEAVLGPGRDIVSESTAIEIVKCVAGPTQKERAIENIIVEPALLSLVCQQLDLRRGGRHITSSLLAGSEEKILENYYESCFEDLPPSVRKAIEKLVTKSGYRENIASESLTDEIGKENLQKLIDCRLLHTEVRDGQPRVELVHDVLTPLVMADRKAHEKEQAEQEKNAREQQILRKKHRRILFTALCSALAIVGWFAYRAHLSAETVKKQNITIQKQNKTIKMASAKLAISTKNLTNTILGTGDKNANLSTGAMVNVIPELEKIQVPLYELNNLLGNDSSESSSILYDLNRLAAISYSLNSDDQTALKHLEKARELIPALAKERRLGSSVDIDCREAAIAVSFYKKTPSEINFKKAADPLYRAINTLDLKSNPSSPSIMSVWRSQKAYNLLARLYLAKKDFNRALKYYNESKNIAETYDPSEEDATIQRMRAISYNGLGNTVTQRVPDRKTNKSSARVLDSLLQSIRYYRKSISIRKKVLTSKIADAWLDHEHAHTLANLSSDLMSYAKNNPALTIEKKMEMANEAYNQRKKRLDIHKKLHLQDPANAIFRRSYAHALLNVVNQEIDMELLKGTTEANLYLHESSPEWLHTIRDAVHYGRDVNSIRKRQIELSKILNSKQTRSNTTP